MASKLAYFFIPRTRLATPFSKPFVRALLPRTTYAFKNGTIPEQPPQTFSEEQQQATGRVSKRDIGTSIDFLDQAKDSQKKMTTNKALDQGAEFKDLSPEEEKKLQDSFLKAYPLLEKPEETKRLRITVYNHKGGSYAHILFELAALDKSLPQVEEAIDRFYSENKNNKPLIDLLNDFSIGDDEKVEKITNEKLDKTNLFTKPLPVIKDVISQLLKDNAFDLLMPMIEAFRALMRDYSHKSHVELVSSTKLNEQSLEYFRKAIMNQYLDPSAQISLTNKVDPTLGSGYIIQIDDTFSLDRSWKFRRHQLENELAESAAKTFKEVAQNTEPAIYFDNYGEEILNNSSLAFVDTLPR